MLVFHNDSDTSYANYAGNLSSMSSATTAVTLNFASTVGTSASNDSVVLTVTAGQEEAVMEGLAGAFAEARSGMTVVADDKNSKYLLGGITALASISVDNGAGTFDNVVAATFTTADTGGVDNRIIATENGTSTAFQGSAVNGGDLDAITGTASAVIAASDFKLGDYFIAAWDGTIWHIDGMFQTDASLTAS